jgi:dihydroxyacid dehydratase/phosphogluconate dehydratase
MELVAVRDRSIESPVSVRKYLQSQKEREMVHLMSIDITGRSGPGQIGGVATRYRNPLTTVLDSRQLYRMVQLVTDNRLTGTFTGKANVRVHQCPQTIAGKIIAQLRNQMRSCPMSPD